MQIELYHGTSVANADAITRHGFKDSVKANRANWSGGFSGKKGFTYLTTAYPFYYAMNAAEELDSKASVLKVLVDTDDLYPDEDFLIQVTKGKILRNCDLTKYKYFSAQSLQYLGNVAIRPQHVLKILGRKDFRIGEMIAYSDPSMSILNYRILGGYYRKLTDSWFHGKEWKHLNVQEHIEEGQLKSQPKPVDKTLV